MERLTEKYGNHYDLIGEGDDNVETFSGKVDTILDKLGKLEDILEKYGLNSDLEELDRRLAENLKQFTQMGYGARTWEDYHKIEEEQGVDIPTVFKAIKNGIYVYTKRYGILFCKYPYLRLDTPEPIFDTSSDFWLPLVTIYLKNYGKKADGGWALEKEELL